jgi:AcrR family transcriptional regulator
LSKEDVADFRERLCEAAERLFAERGPEAVTMRQLATELGVSPMTPYRYFADKDDILAAVRAQGYDRFAQALEAAAAQTSDPVERSRLMGQSYLDFALAHPHTYKLMFDLNQPDEQRFPELVAASARARETMRANARGMLDAGLIEGDLDTVAHAFWAAIHGVVVLQLAGKLAHIDYRTLLSAVSQALFQGLRPKRRG